MDQQEFVQWLKRTQSSEDKWIEDTITRLNGKGALYYTGGEDGVYIRVTPDGILEAGAYEGAFPHIGEAIFQPMVCRDYGTYSAAFGKGLELGGRQFLIDMFTADPVEDPVLRETEQPEFFADNRRFAMRPASPDEAGYFYTLKPEEDAERGAIGHVRIDFGRSGKEFWHTWHPRGPEALNSPEFKAELNEVVDELRKGILKSLDELTSHCRGHNGEIGGGWVQNYGYIVETEHYRYCLRCNPVQGDYQAYLNCYDKRVQEMNQQEQKPPEQGMTMGGM